MADDSSHSNSISSSSSSSSSSALAHIPECDIDDEGVFKYVLIKAVDDSGHQKFLVRGHAWAEYHKHIFNAHREKVSADPRCDG